MGSCEIIPYDPGFREEVAGLLTLLVTRDIREARRYFEWKYEENPYISNPILYLARTEGRIVGMRGLFGATWEAGVRCPPVVIPYADDHVVVEDQRRSGVAAMLMRRVLEDAPERGYDFLVSLSAGVVTALASLAAGWKRVGAMDQVARSLEPGVVTRWSDLVVQQSERLKWLSRRFAWGHTSAAAFDRLDRVGGERDVGTGGTITVSPSPRVEAMAALIARLGHDGRIRHLRDAAYLTWRYRHPLHEYRFLFHERAGILDGYIVLRRFRPDSTPRVQADIVDWEAVEEPVAAALFDRAIRWGAFPMLRSWTATLPEGRVQLLAQAGFAPVELDRRARGVPGVLVMALDAGDPAALWMLNGRPLLDLAQWDVRQIYSMQG